MTRKERVLACLQNDDVNGMRLLIDENKGAVQRTINARKGQRYFNAISRGMSFDMAELLLKVGAVSSIVG